MRFVWSKSSAEEAFQCLLQYTFRKRKVKVPKPVPFAFGTYAHRQIEQFYVKSPKFKSGETYANHLRGWWLQLTRTGRLQVGFGRNMKFEDLDWMIDETLEGEDKEKEIMKVRGMYGNMAKTVGLHVHKEYADREEPVDHERHVDAGMHMDGFGYVRFRGFIDELRHGIKSERPVIVRDHKTGKYAKRGYPVEYDVGFTVYNVAVATSLLNPDDDYIPNHFRVDPKVVREIRKNEDLELALGVIGSEFFFVQPGVLVPTTRRVHHVKDLLERLADTEERIMGNKIIPNRSQHCNYCQFRHECHRLTSTGKLEEFIAQNDNGMLFVGPSLRTQRVMSRWRGGGIKKPSEQNAKQMLLPFGKEKGGKRAS